MGCYPFSECTNGDTVILTITCGEKSIKYPCVVEKAINNIFGNTILTLFTRSSIRKIKLTIHEDLVCQSTINSSPKPIDGCSITLSRMVLFEKAIPACRIDSIRALVAVEIYTFHQVCLALDFKENVNIPNYFIEDVKLFPSGHV